jgi:hypothetical protein
MSNAVAGPGWLLKHSGTLIAEVRDINGPEQTADKDDVTNQSSPDHYREWVTTLLDGGDVTFTCNYIPGDSSQTGLLTALQNRGIEPFTIENDTGMGSAVTISFDARVMKWGSKFPHAKAATLDVTLAVTGPVSIT